MSTDNEIQDTSSRGDLILMPRQRQRSSQPLLPADPMDEELARDWTLSEADMAELRRSRGEQHRRRFALQLCTLRNTGRFLDDYRSVPLRIINHIGCQLELPPVLWVEEPERHATESAYEERIRQYLGYRTFDQSVQEQLKRSLEKRAAEGLLPVELLHRAEAELRAWRVVLPAASTLERLVSSVASQAQQETFERVAAILPPELCVAIDELLEVPEGDKRSGLFQLKEYPPEASAKALVKYIARYHQVDSIVAERLDLSVISPAMVEHLAQMVKRYDAQAPKRYALVACFLAEIEKTLLDHVVEMNDQFLITMSRHARHAFEEQHRRLRRRAKEGVDTLLEAMDLLIAGKEDREHALLQLFERISEDRLRQAVESCREFKRLEERGYLDELAKRFTGLRRYSPNFLSLPLQAERGNEELMTGVELMRKMNAGEIATLPRDAPVSFIQPAWRLHLYREDGRPDRRVWEIGLSLAIRDALRSGDLYLAESRRHVSFWNLVYDERQWADERNASYVQLNLPNEADRVLNRLCREYAEVVERAERGLDKNLFAAVRDGRLYLKRPDALILPEEVKQLRRVIETSLPRVRIEVLLQEVDARCGFTRELRPLGGYEPRSGQLYPALLAALVAHGTNLGIAAMGHSVEGITVDMLQHASRWFLTLETLKAANGVMVNHHHRLAQSQTWGEGVISSSDGQRFGIQASSLLASFYPRYFGYYEKAITLYTHISDQYSVFATRAISCAPREALYVLDGLLENDTILCPREHTTDTHGFTDQLFGLCFLLGYSFMPRLKDLADQQLYKVGRDVGLGRLQPLFHMSVDLTLIREQWDQLVRVAASLRNRVAPAHVVLQRLANASPSDRLAKALTVLGRVVKTNYIIRYIHEEELQRRVQRQLNRGESRHELARWLFFANRGEFRTGDYEEIMNKASCLSLLSNAVLVWNTIEIERVVERLRLAGENVSDEDLAHLSPLMHTHVIPNGIYIFSREGARE
jgi:TnpA family transposase